MLYAEHKIKAYISYQGFCDRIIEALKNEENKSEALKDNLLLLTSDEISEGTIKDKILFSLKSKFFKDLHIYKILAFMLYKINIH